PACPGAALFCDDFESGSSSKWQQISSGPDRFLMIDGQRPYHGIYALHAGDTLSPGMSHGGKFLHKTLMYITQGRLARRAYVYIDVPLGNTFSIFSLTEDFTDYGYEVLIGNRGGAANLPVVQNTRTSVERVALGALTPGAWHCLELVIDFNQGAGGQARL